MAEENKGPNPLATGVAGAIIGAAAAAAAIALSDEKNRKKAEKVLEGLQKEGNKVLKEISKKAMEIKDSVGRAQEVKESKRLKAKGK
ncbi:MAG: hypothetical protein PHV63_04720 [Candidatus Daviesbacteria bacterium]|nr:hypothetical protein [Candidatus Daviesbacteria bacterium]